VRIVRCDVRATRRGRRSAGDLPSEVSVLRWPTGHAADGVFEMFSAEETGWFGSTSATSRDPVDGENVLLLSASTRTDPDGRAVLLSLVNTSPHDAVRLSVKLAGPAPAAIAGTILTAPPLPIHRPSTRGAARVEAAHRPRAFHGATLEGKVVSVVVPARSVVVLTVSH
jgi:hypothetical protein